MPIVLEDTQEIVNGSYHCGGALHFGWEMEEFTFHPYFCYCLEFAVSICFQETTP